jgi:hypothetical protein
VPAIVLFNAPFSAHTPDSPSDPWQPRATTAFHLGRLNRSWLSAAPGRATFLPFFVRLTQLPPRYPSYFYFGSVVRGFLVLILNRTPRLPLLPCHHMHVTIGLSARQRMMSFIFPRGDTDVRSRCAFVLISLCGPMSVHRCFIRTSFHSCVRFLSVRTFLRPFSQFYSVLL